MDTKKPGEGVSQEELDKIFARVRRTIVHSDEVTEKAKKLNAESDRDWEAYKTGGDKPGISDAELKQRLAKTDQLINRATELSHQQKKILEELEANPLEKQCDGVWEDVGRKLQDSYKAEIADAERLGRELDQDERDFAEDERRERAGNPPPLHRVK
jgi:hypothetical protein